MATIPQTTISNAFSWMKPFVLINFITIFHSDSFAKNVRGLTPYVHLTISCPRHNRSSCWLFTLFTDVQEISVVNGGLWDMEQVNSGIGELGQLRHTTISYNQ